MKLENIQLSENTVLNETVRTVNVTCSWCPWDRCSFLRYLRGGVWFKSGWRWFSGGREWFNGRGEWLSGGWEWFSGGGGGELFSGGGWWL